MSTQWGKQLENLLAQGLMLVVMVSLLEKQPMIMNSIMKKRSISNCNSAVTAISHLQYTSQLDFNVHSGTSDKFLLYTVILANRYWWPVYIPVN